MATNAQLTAQIYIAFYNRAPDPVGQEYWIGRLNAGVPLADIANSFAASPEAQATYPYFLAPNLLPPDQFLNQVYLNVFGRPIDTGPGSGLEYYSGKLAAGVSPGEVLLEIIQNAVTNTTPGNTDAEFLANKVEVGLDWSATAANSHAIPGISLYNPDGSLTAAASASAHGVIDGVTADPATVIEGMEETAAFFVPTFTLTTGVDIFDGTTGGTDGNDNFNAPLGVGIDGLVGVQTLQGADVLNGAGGDGDVLNAELNGTGTTENPTISGIETYNFTALPGLFFGGGAIDLSRATGFQMIRNKDSREDLDVVNVREATDIGMQNVLGGTEFYFEYDTDVIVEEQNLIADKVGSVGSGSAVFDLWTGNIQGLTTLNLEVSNGVYLDLEGDADNTTNLVISGSGILELEGDNDFPNLVTLDAVEYTGDLELDVHGSDILESVLTGDGNDFVTVSNDAMDGDLTVDLGGGENTLGIDDNDGNILDHNEINALDFSGGIFNVQTLAFTDDLDFGGPADGPTLDLAGFDVPPATITFQDLMANGRDFTIANAGEDLLLSSSDDFDMGNNGQLIVDGVVNLTVEAGDNVELEGSVAGDVLESLTVTAVDEADVELDTPAVLTALKNVSVSSTGTGTDSDADLFMRGLAGTSQIHGVQQVERFEVEVGNSGDQEGEIIFSSSSLTGGAVATDYDTNAGNDNNAAQDIASDLNAHSDLSATTQFGNWVYVTWDDVGLQQRLRVFHIDVDDGQLFEPDPNDLTQYVTVGVDPVSMVAGTGFEALETVVVDGADDATADLRDVYGHFTLSVTAGDDADVDVFNTDVTSISVVAADFADVDIGGNTIGAPSLTTVTVAANTANVDLGDGSQSNGSPIGNDFSSFTTLDLQNIVTYVEVSTAEAVFAPGVGQYISYLIGATQDGTAAVDVNFTDGNDAREVFDFVGGDIGEVWIADFTAGNDPAIGDRLDLSQFGITGAGGLIFTDLGGNLVITDLGGDDFTGSITLAGLGADAADVASFNIIYA